MGRVRPNMKLNQVLFLQVKARPHTSLHKGGNYSSEMDCSLPSFLQSRFSTLWLPSFWPPKGRTKRKPFCCRQTEAQRRWRVPTLRQRGSGKRHTRSYAKVQKVHWQWRRLCGKKSQYCKRCAIACVNITILITIYEKKIRSTTFVLTVVSAEYIFTILAGLWKRCLKTGCNETQRTETEYSVKLFNMTFHFPSPPAHNFSHPLTTAVSLTTPPSPNMMGITTALSLEATKYDHSPFFSC